MSRLIATLHSPESDRCAIALIDQEQGPLYLQIEAVPPRIRAQQMRAVSWHDGSLYVATPASILVYSPGKDSNRTLLQRTREIQLPEWLLGPLRQADLLGMLISPRRGRILIANNLFNAVDELSLDGKLLRRRFLSEISPETFCLPEDITDSFSYGQIRTISENSNGEVWLTVHRPNDRGCVIDLDSGRKLIDNLSFPHGGLFAKHLFFIQEVRAGRLSAYHVNEEGTPDDRPIWTTTVRTSEAAPDDPLNLRGMAIVGETLYCGACRMDGRAPGDLPARIIGFDMKNGARLATDIPLPDLIDFRRPRVFFLTTLPDQIIIQPPGALTVFLNGTSIEARNHIPGTSLSAADTPTDHTSEETMPPGSGDESKAASAAPQDSTPATGPSPPAASTNSISDVTASPDRDEDKPKIPAVRLEGISLFYIRNATAIFTFNKQKRNRRDFQALADISFTIYEGETIGIIGRNGSGKSTISMVISGALQPDEGTVTTHGRVQLLSIGLGFRNELTGRENVLINGALLGLNKKEILARLPEIEEFAELGSFIDEPVRTYSAGMRSRLGFAVATAVSPDILILDEVMSTGDAAFRKKANERMEAMRERTRTIIVISHSIGQVKQMCSRVIWLHEGRVVMDGRPEQVVPEYDAFCRKPEAWLAANADKFALSR